MPKSYIKRILEARVYDVAIESPIDEAPQLSARFGNRILLKREDLQPVFSFKLRGAYNKIAHPQRAERRGVIAARRATTRRASPRGAAPGADQGAHRDAAHHP
jgi:threonine dehydratase